MPSANYLKRMKRRKPKIVSFKKRSSKNRPYFGHVPSTTLRGAGEFKYFDTIVMSATVITSTPVIVQIDEIPQNDTVNGREGQRWTDTKVRIRGTLRSNTTTTVTNMTMMLIWDYEPKQAVYNISDLLQGGTAVQSLPNRDNQGRLRCLKRWNFSFAGNVTAPATGMECCWIDEYFKLPAGLTAVTTRVDTTGLIGNRIEGALSLIFFSDTATATAAITGTMNARVNFKDN